jgi:prevent-host-death family protein
MNRLLLNDVRPLTEFRANATSFVRRVHQTHRPVLITHRGKSAAILLDVQDYEALLDKIEVLEDIHTAETQLNSGHGIPHTAALLQVTERLSR